MNGNIARPRVLIVSSLQVFPTLSGGNLRTCALANALASRGVEVFVYSFVGRKKDYLARTRSATQEWPSGVREYVNRSLPGFIAGYGNYGLGLPPLWLTAYLRLARALPWDILLPRVLRDKLAWCDAVIADFPFAHPIFKVRSARGKFCVLNTHNVEHHLYDPDAGLRSRALRRSVKSLELKAARNADVVVSCSSADQSYFKSSAHTRHAVVVPNGVDIQRFLIPPEVRRDTRKTLGIADSVVLVLFTASKWGPNQEAFEFLQNFAQTHERELVEHRIHFLVVGGVVDAPLRTPALTATGKVDTVEQYFAAADVGINPLVTGAGTNVKMGEYMAARLPVVVTPFGARGYRIEHRRTGFVFDRDHLMGALREMQVMMDSDQEGLRMIAEAALHENMSVVSMVECVAPLMDAIGDRKEEGAKLCERSKQDEKSVRERSSP